ncbi:hypothetical protein V6N11_004613 [Hibiscus sabdariffa]|uniref:Uncharacterized protein n=1 Tax=Hibiscus sabdariffa TaxID=183260 RepID=A0ABR2SGR8_9ROSI
MPADNRVSPARDKGEWGVDHGSEVAEAGTCYASSDVTDDVGDLVGSLQQDEIKEAKAMTSGSGVAPMQLVQKASILKTWY